MKQLTLRRPLILLGSSISGLRGQGGSAGDHCGVVRRASRGEVLFSGEQYARARRWREEVGAR